MECVFSLVFGKENVKYKINKIEASIKIKRRLLDLCFVNCNVIIIKKSRLNGVFLLQIKDCVLALKQKEVSNIWVEKYGK